MKTILRLLSLTVLVAFSLSASAQEKKFFTPEDASYNNRSLYAQRPNQLKWVGDSDILMKVKDNEIISMTPGSKKEATFLTLDELNGYKKGEGVNDLLRIPQLTWINAYQAYFYALGDNGITLNKMDLKKQTIDAVTSIPQGVENQTICKPTLNVAYTIDNNLYVAKGDTQIQITDNPKGVIAGQSVHRNEFAINGGIFWSPDGKLLAYYSMDERMVTDYPLVDINERIATTKPIKYPMAGMTSHQVTLHVYNIATGKEIVVKTGEPVDQYLTAITWNPDNKRIYIGVLNREQNYLKFNEYDAITGDFIQTIFEDRDEQYVEPQGPAYFLPDNRDQFIWKAQRDGYYHLYLYTISKGTCKQLTKGNFVITDFNGFSKDGSKIYYRSTEVSPLERHCYMMDIKSGAVTKLTKEHGTHDGIPSGNGKYSSTSTAAPTCHTTWMSWMPKASSSAACMKPRTPSKTTT